MKYDAHKVQGATNHQDVDSVFCSALVYIRDTYKGRLHVKNFDLQDILNPCDVVFMDPRQIHHFTMTT